MPEHVDPPFTVEVADGVHAYIQPDGSWWLNNTGFVVGHDTVVAVDATSTSRRTRSARSSTRIITATTPTATVCSSTQPSSVTGAAAREYSRKPSVATAR